MKDVRKLCDVLRTVFDMRDWYFELERVKKDGGADVLINHRYRRIRIRIFNGFFEADREWQASTLVHEFTHMFNVPIFSLLEEAWDGKMITRTHAEDILEQCNTRAETVLVRLLRDATLKKAYNEYTKRRGLSRPKARRKPSKRRSSGRRPRKGPEVPANRDEEVRAEGAFARHPGPR